MIRPGNLQDLDALHDLENHSFETDRLSRQDLKRTLKSRALLLVEEELGKLRGYVLVRFHPRSRRAHLHSIATAPNSRRTGVGRALLRAAEDGAQTRGAACMQLEIREDNHPALGLYEAMGYQQFGTWLDYYQDHGDARRMQKTLSPGTRPLPGTAVGFEIRCRDNDPGLGAC